jgi:HAD superfamily hydrolase (TIGR01490 family)
MNTAGKLMHSDQIYAFFDVDDTLISVKSMLSFQEFWYERFNDVEGQLRYYADLRQHMHADVSWEFLNRLYYQHFKGRKVADVKLCGEAWFQMMHSTCAAFFNPVPLAELRYHQCHGHEIVFVSGSFPALLRPIADFLRVRHILATTLEIKGGIYTGDILAPQTIGEGKVEAIKLFLNATGGEAINCYAYGDDISDLPMLETVGNPVVVKGGRKLEHHALGVGWKIISPV